MADVEAAGEEGSDLDGCHAMEGRQGSQWDGGDELCCSHGRLCFCLRGGLGLVIVVLCFDQWHDLHTMAMLGLGKYVLLHLIEPVDQYIAARTRNNYFFAASQPFC